MPAPTPTPESQGESESEGRPKRSAAAAQLSFIVYQLDNVFPDTGWMAEGVVMDAFISRLTRSKDVSAVPGGRRLSRKEAQERAKSERESYVVLVELEEDLGPTTGRGGVGQGDTRTLAIKTYVYEPVTGTLKFVDHTSQRPYRPSTTVGGVRLPLPVPRTRVERFPNELQLEQAAHDAADRLMHRFNLRPPPDD